MYSLPVCLRFVRLIYRCQGEYVNSFSRFATGVHRDRCYSTAATEEAQPPPAGKPPPPPPSDDDKAQVSSPAEDLSKTLQELTKQRDDLTVQYRVFHPIGQFLRRIAQGVRGWFVSKSRHYDNFKKDKYKRSLAESENMRKRLMKQIDEAKLFGIQSFCKDLLEVADILGKATECVPKEEITDKNPHLKNLYEGLAMTEAQLHKVFKRHGLTPVNPLNEKFDPNLHEALFQQEVEGKSPGTVVVVSKLGYKLHERVVRPALVGVAKG